MKIIILAAGQGTRLRPYTDTMPKGMVEVCGKPILDYQMELFEKAGITDIIIVTGYKQEKINYNVAKKVINKDFMTTNMVSSLFCAKDLFDDDLIISYGDIIYSEDVLNKIIEAEGDFSVIVDKNWKKLWELRMEDPLADAESMKIKDGKIVELGKKAKNVEDIEGQYIGLMKISKSFLPEMISFYNSMDRSKEYDGKDFDNMFMTSLIQMIIDKYRNVTPVYIQGEWVEVDSVSDLEIYSSSNYVQEHVTKLQPK